MHPKKWEGSPVQDEGGRNSFFRHRRLVVFFFSVSRCCSTRRSWDSAPRSLSPWRRPTSGRLPPRDSAPTRRVERERERESVVVTRILTWQSRVVFRLCAALQLLARFVSDSMVQTWGIHHYGATNVSLILLSFYVKKFSASKLKWNTWFSEYTSTSLYVRPILHVWMPAWEI